MSTGSILRKVPWKIALPAIVMIITMFLLHLDTIWLQKTRGMDDMPSTSAWGLICLLNWPGLFLTSWLRYLPGLVFGLYLYDGGRLTAGVLFWVCIGSLLDRKLAGVVGPVIRSKPLRISLYGLGFSVALYALVFGGLELVGLSITWFPHLSEIVRSRWIYLFGRELNTLAAALWGLIGTLYFRNRLLRCRSARPASAT